ncbi:two-component response regulator ARR18-like [Phoenix dactylifera]|uniref:Two-component response regulator ARR18-like n=1 Tax=Phoenix dactylifera TaxID=42345 RepID=A0A8B9AAI7_PHODC|nr:two-component response regulator ARR18-like [Phoenix dactylifera]
MLKHFVNELDLPIITMCAYDDNKIRHESLHHGACLHLTKPITIIDLGVISQKAWFQREHMEERYESVGSQPNVEEVGQVGASSSSKTPKGGSSGKNEFIWKRQEGGGSEKPKKAHLEWDFELHQRFLLAAALVGERAPPSRIYELMGVEGLTISQVSNRLQRHRTHLRRLERSTEIHPLREIRPMPSFTQPIFAPFIAAPYPPMHSSGWTQPVDMTDKSPPAADDIDDIFDVRNYVFDDAAIAKMLDEITRENDTTP